MKAFYFCCLAMIAVLCGCEEGPEVAYYHYPLTSPGGKFALLPPTVQNTVRAEAGMTELTSVSRLTGPHGMRVYEMRFANPDIYPPLYVAPDGSVLSPDLTAVVVPATEDTIAASTGSAASGTKMDDLPLPVVKTIREQAPTAEVDTITRLTSGLNVFYSVVFKDPANHPRLLIRDDGRLVQ